MHRKGDVLVGDDPGSRGHDGRNGIDDAECREDVTERHELLNRRRIEIWRRQDVDLRGDRGPALDLNRPPHADVPVGLEGVTFSPAHAHLDVGARLSASSRCH
jgi:hypothetical protein